MNVIPVFVSSTYIDLREEREAVVKRLQAMDGIKPVNMENFGGRDHGPLEASLELVDSSQIYVGIFGDRFGSGITAEEYHQAYKNNLRCLIFFVGDGTSDPDLESLKAELRKRHLPKHCDRAALAEEVATAVHNLIMAGKAEVSAPPSWRDRFAEYARLDFGQWRASASFKRFAEVHVSPESIFLVPQESELVAGRRKFERYSVEKAIAGFNPLLIIGEPGTGKTTALRQMTSLYLDRAQTSPDSLLPLFVPVFPLANVEHRDRPGDEHDIADELIRSALKRLNPGWGGAMNEFWHALEQGHAFLVLFDGLNEIPEKLIPDYCSSVAALHKKLAARSPQSRVVISSRIDNLARSIDAVRRMSQHIFEVEKLTDKERLQAFVAAQLPDPVSRRTFHRLLDERPAARLMAQNPFLLMAMLASYERSGRLPLTRSVLLRELAALLLEGESGGKETAPDPRLAIQHAVLGDLGIELRRRGLGLGAPRSIVEGILRQSFERCLAEEPVLRRAVGANYLDTLIDDLVAKRVLTKDWWFVDEKGQSVPGVRFWLEVIQEYFAATVVVRAIESLYAEGGTRVDRKRHRRELAAYIESSEWHQVLSIAIGLTSEEPARQAFHDVCKASPLVAGLCIAGGHTAGESAFVAGVQRTIRRTVWATSLFVGFNGVVALAIAAGALWGAHTAFDGGWPVGGIRAADLLPLALRLGFLLVLCGMPWVVPSLELLEDRIVMRLLPDRYIQPLLRSLIAAGTEKAVQALSALERDFQGKRTVPKRIRFYIRQANRVWRFQKEERAELLKMLADPHQADYAIDRLEQCGDAKVIPALLRAARTLRATTAANALRAAVRLCHACEAPHAEELLQELRALQADTRLPWRVRLAAFRGRRSLGDIDARPPLVYYLVRLTPSARTVLLFLATVGMLSIGAYFLLRPRLMR